MLKITEIFRSIQGEGPETGLPCTFVRLCGCNLRCKYCDTEYAYDGGSEMEIPTIVSEVSKLGSDRVLVTGGEPMFQKRTLSLLNALLQPGADLSLETNGSMDLSQLPEKVRIIMDIKCPGSGEESFYTDNLNILKAGDEIKFVVSNIQDLEFAEKIISKHADDAKNAGYGFRISPAEGMIKAEAVADFILKKQLPATLGIQIHKIIWPDRSRGV